MNGTVTGEVLAHPSFALVIVAATMLGEAALSGRHDARLRARGAVEPPDDVYRGMQLVYPVGFAACIAEQWWRGSEWGLVSAVGLGVFVAGKAVKYAAIAALGERWTFRVLPVPGQPLVAGGPYRWLRHPNYVGVMGEVVGIALWMQAIWTGPIFVVAFAWLLRLRIAVEERALAAALTRS